MIIEPPPLPTPSRFKGLGALAIALLPVFAGPLRAQDHTVAYDTADPGVTRSITNWGLDTCWANFDNMQRGLIFMGASNVNLVRVGFFVDAPLTNNDVTPANKSAMQTCINLANMATAATRWDMNLNTGVNAWYTNGVNTVYPDRWAAAINACQRYYNRSFWMVEGFNEPDYIYNNEGSAQNLYDILGYLQASNNFAGTLMAGGSTLNTDPAVSWFNAVAGRASVGTTHCLAGSAASYVNFLQTVTASNAMPVNPELHNVMEAIMGVNYGLKGGIWWGTAERARGDFVKACQGKRLGYADDLSKWTAAAVYRGTNGNVQTFVGASERMAATTSYRFFSKDRDVFYDGDGPRRDFTVTIPGGSGYATADQRNAERVVNVTWGADVPPAINGRYLIVNRNSGKVLEVPGAGTGNGIQLDQTTYTGALNQQWDVNPIPSTFGGDYSYYSIKAAHSGATVDLNNYSYANGAAIQQWNGGTNAVEQWYFQYTTNGYFKIRSKWSNKVMGVNGASAASGALILQWDDNGTPDHEWRFIPTNAAVEFVAPAPPSLLTATANAVSVQLSWKTNSETDFAGYTVLRSTNSGGPYDIVARGLTNNSFTDKSANQSKTYFYVVKAADKSLNVSANSAQVSATPTVIPTVVARYSFDGNTNDSSGNANHPIITFGTPTFPAGKYGSAMDLDGTNQYTMLPANMLASVTNFTIACWVNWDGGANWQRIFDFGNDTTQYMFLSPSSGGGTLRFAVTTNGGGGEQILETSPLPIGQWRHVAITRNGNTAKLYTNGIVAASTTSFTNAPASFNPALNYLGKSQYADALFNGRLDEFYIYNYALNDAEIVALANSAGVPPTPTNLAAASGNNQVGLNWNTSSNATSYNVKRATVNGGPYSTIGSPATTNYTDATAGNGTTYYYVVSAVNISGEGTNSSQVSATPLPPIPSVPAGLSATAGDAQVVLSWAASSGATSYNVKRTNVNGGSYTTVTNVTMTSHTDNGLVNGTTYYYVVTAVNAGGESGDSTQVNAMPVSTAPVTLTLAASSGDLKFSWPADHTGWRLQTQTNTLAMGLGTNWFDVVGSTTTNIMLLPVDANDGCVLYRLLYP